jgi:hypothetical protein
MISEFISPLFSLQHHQRNGSEPLQLPLLLLILILLRRGKLIPLDD